MSNKRPVLIESYLDEEDYRQATKAIPDEEEELEV